MTQSPFEPIESCKTGRVIGHMRGEVDGPTILFFGGIHGNEDSGVKALEKLFSELDSHRDKLKGNVFAIRGNIPALEEERRFLENDLNRIWTSRGIDSITTKEVSERNSEEDELVELHSIISDILSTYSPPYYFIDYHTTSSPTLPFITINDALINRKFARLFPVPIILGIEEYLEGPLLSYINEKGFVAIGFESGQHHTEAAVRNSNAFSWLVLRFTGALPSGIVPVEEYYSLLKNEARQNNSFYEIIHRHLIKEDDKFEMLPGFRSFDTIPEGTRLASHNGKQLHTDKKSVVFMPLYQEQGEDGFFLIRKIPKWILKLSSAVRMVRFDSFLTFLPGINWASPKKDKLIVNLKVARFFSKPFFHLMGYRSRTVDETHMLMNNRERTSRKKMYRGTAWYRKNPLRNAGDLS